MHCTKDTFDLNDLKWKIWWTDDPIGEPIGSGFTEREAKEDAIKNMEFAIERLMGAHGQAGAPGTPPALHLHIAKELDNLARKMIEKSFGEAQGANAPANTRNDWEVPAQAISNALLWNQASLALQSAVQYLAKIK